MPLERDCVSTRSDRAYQIEFPSPPQPVVSPFMKDLLGPEHS